MPFPMRIQPIDFNTPEGLNSSQYQPVKSVVKSRFKRLFERQFLRNSAAEKGTAIEEFEPSSVCLAKMVQNFIENTNDSPESESEPFNCFADSNNYSGGDACENLKSLVTCASIREKNLLAEFSKILEKNNAGNLKYDCIREIVVDDLLALGYNASICKSRWEKSSTYPAGEYEYLDVIMDGDRLIVDIDFRSEFEIARSTKTYKAVLQILPQIFVGKSDRLQKIINIVSESSKQSLKKKGMPFPPWRKSEYLKAKWLSPCTRTTQTQNSGPPDRIFKQKTSPTETDDDPVFSMSGSWEPPEIRSRSSRIGFKIITGLASVIEDQP